jgi:glyoxalase/bleomycin resistance protein/dioxygenase superfamily protein
VGFTVDPAGNCLIGDVRLVLEGGTQGLCAWSLDGIDSGGGIDGLATHRAVGATLETPVLAAHHTHPNGVVAIDHVVVTSPDPTRTMNALQAVGLEPRRTREHGTMRQTFFRLGPVILELVGPAAPDGDGPARFWGIAFTVADLDATVRFLGDHLGRVKDAVQPGRRIASLRKEAGLALPVAFMS